MFMVPMKLVFVVLMGLYLATDVMCLPQPIAPAPLE